MDWKKLASQVLAGDEHALKTKGALYKAYRTRKATAELYARDPDQAVAHVNGKLDEASRQEESRHNSLAGSL